MSADNVPTYVVKSVAFPTLLETYDPHRFDDVHVDLHNGSGLEFSWYPYGIKVTGFDDGLLPLTDPRIVRILRRLDAKHIENGLNDPSGWARGPTVDVGTFREMLEAEGIMPDPEYMPKGA